MKKFLLELQERHSQQILNELKVVYYKFNRYHHNYTIALFYSEDEFDYELVYKDLRMTDKIIKLENNLFVLIFEYSDIPTGVMKAAEKLLLSLLQSPPHNIYISIEECTKNDDGDVVVRRLFTLINYAIRQNCINEIVDTSYLDRIY